MKEIEIILSKEAKAIYCALYEKAIKSKFEKVIFNSINKKLLILKLNPYFGNNIAKRLIPKGYVLKHNVNNLFRIELSNFWRLLYTVKSDGSKLKILIFILDIVDHKLYNKKFKYK